MIETKGSNGIEFFESFNYHIVEEVNFVSWYILCVQRFERTQTEKLRVCLREDPDAFSGPDDDFR